MNTTSDKPAADVSRPAQLRAVRSVSRTVPTMPTSAGTARASSTIKSRARVRNLGEVFTGDTQVQAMLDLVAEQANSPSSRFLEPACGNGNFLVAVLERKLAYAHSHYKKLRKKRNETREDFEGRRQDEYEFLVFIAVSSIYGIDISAENIAQAHERLNAHIIENYYLSPRNALHPHDGLLPSLVKVLETNIVVGDTLNDTASIVLTEYSFPGTDIAKARFGFTTTARQFCYQDLLDAAQKSKNAKPVKTARARHFREVA